MMIVENLHKLMSSTNIFMTPIQFNILKTLNQHGELTRNEICEKLNAPRTTVFNNLEKLEKKKFVKKYSKETGFIGRPKVFWKIDNLNL